MGPEQVQEEYHFENATGSMYDMLNNRPKQLKDISDFVMNKLVPEKYNLKTAEDRILKCKFFTLFICINRSKCYPKQ